MSDLHQNPVDAILTLLRIGPDDNRWTLPEVVKWRAYCNELVRGGSGHEVEPTFSEDEVRVVVKMPSTMQPEPAETEAERVERLTTFSQSKGRLL